MVGECLQRSGYWMGDDLMPPTAGNPRGYFESYTVEGINERLLEQVVPARSRGWRGRWQRGRMDRGQRWLARLGREASVAATAAASAAIADLTARRPFAFKDPRFCYTWPVWRPHVGDAAVVVVFREPAATATSILRECAREAYLRRVRMTWDRALAVWRLQYERVLGYAEAEPGRWHLVHYDDMMTGAGIARLEAALGTALDTSGIDPGLRRSGTSGAVPADIQRVYARLCARAGREA